MFEAHKKHCAIEIDIDIDTDNAPERIQYNLHNPGVFIARK